MGVKNLLFFLFPLILFSNTHFKLDTIPKYNHEIDSNYFSFFLTSKPPSKSSYKFALLLPFCNQKNTSIDELNIDSLILLNQEKSHYDFYKKSKISIDFFLGFLLSLKQINEFNVDLFVYDISEGEDSKYILDNFLNDKNINDFDLIIGPLYMDNFLYFSQNFTHSIPVVNPFSTKSIISDSIENIFQVQSNIEDYLSVFSDYIFNTHKEDNFILIRRDTVFRTDLIINDFNDTLNIIDTLVPKDIYYTNLLLNDVDTSLINFEEIKVANTVIDSIHHKLDTLGMQNIIIIPSEDNIFVTDLLSKLHACRDSGMTVYGLDNLFNFEYFSVHELMDLNVTFPHHKVDTNNYIDAFIIDFYDTYKYVPQIKYASVGYEVGLYFSDLFSKHTSVLKHTSYMEPKIYLETMFNFKKSNFGGFKNQGYMILRYQDFGYKKIHQ
ncbi:hypothetical protein OAJ42_00635 [Flavobacteriales bacterium]|nr:hypothetical protein [Flavobacteriales bacterium]